MHYKQHKLSRWALCVLGWNVKIIMIIIIIIVIIIYKFTVAPFNIIKNLSKALYSLKFIKWIYKYIKLIKVKILIKIHK